MADLKAAAKEMREIVDGSWSGRESRDACILAAQALEAWAWMAKNRFVLDHTTTEKVWWNCYLPFSGQYYEADTPLGAVLAAMEGEEDDKG